MTLIGVFDGAELQGDRSGDNHQEWSKYYQHVMHNMKY